MGYFGYKGNAPKKKKNVENKSTGCGNSFKKKEFNSLKVNNKKRKYLLSIPYKYNRKQPHNLVFAFHGRTNSNKQVRSYYEIEENFTEPTIFVYPGALRARDGKYTWNNDTEFYDSLYKTITKEYCVDLDSVYLVGHSLGASFANSLACARGGEVRAVASLGGGGAVKNCSGKFGAMIMHNPRDRLVPVKYGIRVRDSMVVNNGLNNESKKTDPRSFKCVRYGNKNEHNPVIWCPHRKDHSSRGKYYPHNWPNGTGEKIMSFFESLPN